MQARVGGMVVVKLVFGIRKDTDLEVLQLPSPLETINSSLHVMKARNCKIPTNPTNPIRMKIMKGMILKEEKKDRRLLVMLKDNWRRRPSVPKCQVISLC